MLESHESTEFYTLNGYAVVRDVFCEQTCRAFADECERLSVILAHADDKRVAGRKHDVLGRIMDRLDPVIDVSPVFKALSTDVRITDAATRLLGEPVALFKDKLITKPPGTHGYDIHQDYPYWESVGLPADDMLTAWVAIDHTTKENGALELFSGLHHARIPGTPESPMDVDETLLEHASSVLLELNAGDVLFFHSLAPHRSAPNRSERPRRALLFTFVPGRHEGLYEKYYHQKFH